MTDAKLTHPPAVGASAHQDQPAAVRRGGRPKAFDEETVKVALFLPPELAGCLKAFAARRRQTPSLVIADWIRKAEIQEAIARGRKDFEAGDVLSHEDAVARLSKL